MRPDNYDRAVDYLCENPGKLYSAWSDGGISDSEGSAVGSCLFQYAMKDFDSQCGCLTMIRNDPFRRHAETEALTLRIIADERIPLHWNKIPVDDPVEFRASLNVFAGWQRELDRVLGRNGVPKESDSCVMLDIPAPHAPKPNEECCIPAGVVFRSRDEECDDFILDHPETVHVDSVEWCAEPFVIISGDSRIFGTDDGYCILLKDWCRSWEHSTAFSNNELARRASGGTF